MMIGGHLCRMDCFGSTTHATMRRYIHRWRKTSFRRQGSQSKDGSTHPHNSTSSRLRSYTWLLLCYTMVMALCFLYIVAWREDKMPNNPDEYDNILNGDIRSDRSHENVQVASNKTLRNILKTTIEEQKEAPLDLLAMKKFEELMKKGMRHSFPEVVSHPEVSVRYEKTDFSGTPDVLKLLHWPLRATQDDSHTMNMQFDTCVNLPSHKTCKILPFRTQYNESDLVIFNAFSFGLKSPPWPMYKPKDQTWLLYGHEPVGRTISSTELQPYADKFDLLASYKAGSNMYLPYGQCWKKSEETAVDSTPKSGLAVVFVSKCTTDSLREKYLTELRKYVYIDVFGSCNLEKCKMKDHACLKRTITKYKFYLAFENSLCDEYVSEKAFRALQFKTVPIVLGKASFQKHLPPNSYIDVRDFKSPRELANYILWLDKNEDMYQHYFQWTKNHECEFRNGVLHKYGCELCELAYKYKKIKDKKPVDIMKQWNKENECQTWDEFTQGIL